MYTKNQNFINAFLKSDGSIREDRLLDAKIDVFYSENGEDKIFTFSSRDILQSMRINENLMSSEYYSLGSACSNQLTLSILFDTLRPDITNEAKKAFKARNKIIPYIGICVDEDTMEFEYIPMGVYFIYNTSSSVKFKTCSITAYDKMFYLSELPSEELTAELYDIITNVNNAISNSRDDEMNLTYKILETIAREYDFELDESVLQIISESITKTSTNAKMYNTFYIPVGTIRGTGTPFPTDDCTVRQYVSYIAGAGGYNAYFDREGRFVFRGRYNKNGSEKDRPAEGEATNVMPLFENDAFDINTSLEEINFASVDITYSIFDEDTPNTVYMAFISDLGMIGGVGSQIRYAGVYIMPQLAEWLADRFKNSYIKSYIPTSVKWRCCPFTECGDTLIVEADGENIILPVMEQEIVFAGGLSSTVKSLGQSTEDTAFKQNYDSSGSGIIANSGNIAGFSIKPRMLSKTFTYEEYDADTDDIKQKNTTLKIGHEGGSSNANYIIALQEEDNTSYSYGLHSNGDIDCGNIYLAPECRLFQENITLVNNFDSKNAVLSLNQTVYFKDDESGRTFRLSEQPIGIVLCFAHIRTDKTPDPYQLQYHFIPKQALVFSSASKEDLLHTTVRMATSDFSAIGAKQLTVFDNRIVGESANNTASGTKNGVTFNNADWGLYRVYGV